MDPDAEHLSTEHDVLRGGQRHRKKHLPIVESPRTRRRYMREYMQTYRRLSPSLRIGSRLRGDRLTALAVAHRRSVEIRRIERELSRDRPERMRILTCWQWVVPRASVRSLSTWVSRRFLRTLLVDRDVEKQLLADISSGEVMNHTGGTFLKTPCCFECPDVMILVERKRGNRIALNILLTRPDFVHRLWRNSLRTTLKWHEYGGRNDILCFRLLMLGPGRARRPIQVANTRSAEDAPMR